MQGMRSPPHLAVPNRPTSCGELYSGILPRRPLLQKIMPTAALMAAAPTSPHPILCRFTCLLSSLCSSPAPSSFPKCTINAPIPAPPMSAASPATRFQRVVGPLGATALSHTLVHATLVAYGVFKLCTSTACNDMLVETMPSVQIGCGIYIAVGSTSASAPAPASSADWRALERAGVTQCERRGPRKPPKTKPPRAAARSAVEEFVKYVTAVGQEVEDFMMPSSVKREGRSMPSCTVVPVTKAHHTPETANVRLSTSPVDRQKRRRAELGGEDGEGAGADGGFGGLGAGARAGSGVGAFEVDAVVSCRHLRVLSGRRRG